MLMNVSLKATQLALNQALALDSMFAKKIEPLTDKWLAIVIEPLQLRFFMSFSHNGVVLQETLETRADATIYSSPLGFIRLSLLPASKARSLFNDNIRMEGDVEFAQAVKQVFDSLDFDWEGHLAQFTGDVIAHHIGTTWRKSKQFGERLFSNVQQSMDEFLHEEIRALPGREELEDFYQDLAELAVEVDRLEASFQWLEASDEIH